MGRMKKSTITLALVASLLSVLPNLAVADDKEIAKAKFQEGLALIQEENYPAALAAFEESNKLVPKSSILYNIGMCQKALFRYVDSIASFKQYLGTMGASITPEMKQTVDQALSDMRKMVGTVAIEGAPDGAEVFVDERSVGITPFKERLIVDPGSHSIRVEHDGFKPLRTDVTVPQGVSLDVSAKLQPVAAWIKVGCEAKDAVVHLDGKVVGGCPYEGEVQPGEHEVKVREPGKPEFVQKVDVTSGGTATVAVTLQPSEPGEQTPEEQKKAHTLFIAGITTLAVGAGAGVLGLAFNVKGTKDESKAEDAPPNSSERQGFNDDIKTDKAVMIAGYAAGGVLVVVGVVLMAISRKGSERASGNEPIAFEPTVNGLSMSF
ncbi:MAG: PEGA domain-containing protein [Proteobacteria bacterium]|jgi:hypothetical protein|nr:PEGA domain-containing protein [Pseudomonadota bacterium]